MGYGQFLRDMLRPLGAYALLPESFSGAELEALGQAMDAFWDEAREGQQQTIVQTATDAGLSKWERLLPYRTGQTDQQRRAAIGGFLSISGDSFTLDSLRRCLVACGVTAVVEETAQRGVVTVRFPDLMGEPAGFARIKTVIEEILPCHLQVEYLLRFFTWGDSARLTWGDLAVVTWGQWRVYGG